MDFQSLSDAEIRSQLTEAGVPVGPIVDATRKVYIRKLQRLRGELPEEHMQVADEEESEEDNEQIQTTPVTRQRPMTAKVRSPPPATGDQSPGEVKHKRQQRKLNVPISKEVTESSSGGLFSVIVKLAIFAVVVLAAFYILSSTSGEVKEITSD